MTNNPYQAELERRDRETQRILTDSLKETIINPTLVGISASFSSFNPHNYRLYFDYEKPKQGWVERSVLGRFDFIKIQNSTERVYLHVETGWKVTAKKNQVELRKKHINRDWKQIDNAHVEEADRVIEQKRLEGIRVFKEFVEDYNISTTFTLLNEYVIDNAVKNILTEKVPINAFWQDDVSKKLYGENKVEYSKLIYAKNEMRNAGLKAFSPEIVEHLSNIYKKLSGMPQEDKLKLFSVQELKAIEKNLKVYEGWSADYFEWQRGLKVE